MMTPQVTLDYFNNDTLAASTYINKYAMHDLEENCIEPSPDQMHDRLADAFYEKECQYPNPMSREEIRGLLDRFKQVIPQGSPMSVIGNPFYVQSSGNCFVVKSPYDSYGGILHTDQQLTQIFKRRGGVGVDISTIRPQHAMTRNAAKTTDGIGVFMERYSNTTREVAQKGRRGALMLSISVEHPEIETFINIKRNLDKVTGANISVRVTDEFMRAVKADTDFTLRFPCEAPITENSMTRVVRAREIWDQMMAAATDSAEPGVLFWDTIIKNSPADIYGDRGFKTVSTNPCGELPLSVGDSCRLMVVVASSFVRDPFLPTASFDFESFTSVVKKAQRLMDDMVDIEKDCIDRIIAKVNSDPEPDYIKAVELNLWKQVRTSLLDGRRTGLGLTAIGDTLAFLGLRYGSPESIAMTDRIYRALAVGSHQSSLEMAAERGAFPAFSYAAEKEHPYLSRIMEACGEPYKSMWATTGRRNIANTTTAPVGSVSVVAQTTSGIEPTPAVKYKRRKKINPSDKSASVDFVDALGDKWQEYTVYHHGFSQWMEVTGGTAVEDSPYAGSTATEIDWVASVDLQAAAQRWIDHSISKTCNLPNSATKELVAEVYMRAWEQGCKGFTVYRDGSRQGVLILGTEKEKRGEADAAKRPTELQCDIHRTTVRSGGESQSWLILVGVHEGAPYEVFCGLADTIDVAKKVKKGVIVKNGKKEGVTTYNLKVGDAEYKDITSLFDNPTQGAFTRTISLALRHRIPLQYVVEQMLKDKQSDMFSFAKVVARVLKTYIPDGVRSSSEKKCASCGSGSLIYIEGCVTCSDCGFSKCG